MVSSREAPGESKVENGASLEKSDKPDDVPMGSPQLPPATSAAPLTNGCSSNNRDGTSVNGASNGASGVNEEGSSVSMKSKEDSPGKKKGLLPLIYDVVVIGEDRKIKDVPAKDLQ